MPNLFFIELGILQLLTALWHFSADASWAVFRVCRMPPTGHLCSLTLLLHSNVSKEDGCLRYIPGSHLEPQLRRHTPGGPYCSIWWFGVEVAGRYNSQSPAACIAGIGFAHLQQWCTAVA